MAFKIQFAFSMLSSVDEILKYSVDVLYTVPNNTDPDTSVVYCLYLLSVNCMDMNYNPPLNKVDDTWPCIGNNKLNSSKLIKDILLAENPLYLKVVSMLYLPRKDIGK